MLQKGKIEELKAQAKSIKEDVAATSSQKDAAEVFLDRITKIELDPINSGPANHITLALLFALLACFV